VIGFPLGYSPTAIKVEEAMAALADGAGELDMVINICELKNGAYNQVLSDIMAVRAICRGRVLKVIAETCYLTGAEKNTLCDIVTASGADYIKTSTGFGPAGAVLSDIELFRERLGPGVRIKAAGGIKSLGELEDFINAGCDRVGTSGAVALLRELGVIS
jgi:deoxyribose-phosphate aldolase